MKLAPATLILALIGAILSAPAFAVPSTSTSNSTYLISLAKADANRDGRIDGAEAQIYCATHEVECKIFLQRLLEGNPEAGAFAKEHGLGELLDDSEVVRLGDVSNSDEEWDVSGKTGWSSDKGRYHRLSGNQLVYHHPAYGVVSKADCTNVLRRKSQPVPPPRAELPPPEPEPQPEPVVPTAILVEHHVSGSIDVNVHGSVRLEQTAPRRQVDCPEAFRAFAQNGPGNVGGGRVRVNTAEDLAEYWASAEPHRCNTMPVPVYRPPQQVCQAPPRRGGGGQAFASVVNVLGGFFGGQRRPPPSRQFVPPRPPMNRVVMVPGPPITVTQNNNQNNNQNQTVGR